MKQFRQTFRAMGTENEIELAAPDMEVARRAAAAAIADVRRIESKYSRYRDDSVTARINAAAGGAPVRVDPETAALLRYADQCHALSDGLFDITSGVLRRAWTFDGGRRVPDAGTLQALLAHVGWARVTWQRPTFVLPAGMEIDFGGIGKEYAVDRAATRMSAPGAPPFLVNFGGDLFAHAPDPSAPPWIVGVDDPEHTGEATLYRIELSRGALATSGDARRYVMHEGRRLGHILDPRTGWPVEGAPRAVTVLAPTCLEAGTLATFAILHGPGAKAFLDQQGVTFRVA